MRKPGEGTDNYSITTCKTTFSKLTIKFSSHDAKTENLSEMHIVLILNDFVPPAEQWQPHILKVQNEQDSLWASLKLLLINIFGEQISVPTISFQESDGLVTIYHLSNRHFTADRVRTL